MISITNCMYFEQLFKVKYRIMNDSSVTYLDRRELKKNHQ